MQQRRGTAAQWTAANPILAAGEIGFATDTSKFKMGNGTSTWSQLEYFANAAELEQAITNVVGLAPETLNTLSEISDALGDNPDFLSALATNTRLDSAIVSQSAALTTATNYASGLLNTHVQNTLQVHGIPDTSLLATTAHVATAKSEATTAAATDATSKAATAKSEAITAAGTAADTKISTAVAALTSLSVGLGSVNDTPDAAKPVSSAQASAIATAKTEAITSAGQAADTNLSTHNTGTTNVHGIADTSALATKVYADAAVSTHESDTTSVHGIANTALLALKSEVAAVTATTLGLGNVTNTADASKPVSTAQASAIATAKAEAIADATSQVNALLTGAPAALNTLDELAAALGDDANFAATVTTSLGLKVDSLTPISQKTASYTLSSLTERDDLIEMNSASAMTLTIPPASAVDYPIGTSIDILQTGAGQVTVAAGAGVTVNATPGLKLRTQWSGVTLFKRAANTWVVYGDLSA
jgi:hypothetical protein